MQMMKMINIVISQDSYSDIRPCELKDNSALLQLKSFISLLWPSFLSLMLTLYLETLVHLRSDDHTGWKTGSFSQII